MPAVPSLNGGGLMLRICRWILPFLAVTFFAPSYAEEVLSVEMFLLQAENATRELEDESDVQDFLLQIAEIEARNRNSARGDLILNELRESALEVGQISVGGRAVTGTPFALEQVARREAEFGYVERARVTLGLIDPMSESRADAARLGIISSLIVDKRFDDALAISSDINRDYPRSVELADIGVGFAEAGRLTDAANIIESIKGLTYKTWLGEIKILTAIAAYEARSSQERGENTLFRASQLARRLPEFSVLDDRPRRQAFDLVASAWARIGREDEALRMIRLLPDDLATFATLRAALAAAQGGKVAVSQSLLRHAIEQGVEGFAAEELIESIHLQLGDIESALRSVALRDLGCYALASSFGGIAAAQAHAGNHEAALATMRRVATYSEPDVASVMSVTR